MHLLSLQCCPRVGLCPNTAYVLSEVGLKGDLAEFVKSSGGEVKNNKPGESVTHIITSQVIILVDFVQKGNVREMYPFTSLIPEFL